MEMFHVLVALEHEGSIKIMRTGKNTDYRTLNANGYWVPTGGGAKHSVPILAWPTTAEGTVLAKQAVEIANQFRSTEVSLSQIGGSCWRLGKNIICFDHALHSAALRGHAVTYNTKSMQAEFARVKCLLAAFIVRTVYQAKLSAESKAWSHVELKKRDMTGSWFSLAQYLTGKKAASTIAAIESGETSIELTGTPELSLLELKEAVAWANEISNP